MPPPVRISLEELARDAGDGYGTPVFELLRSRLRDPVGSETEQVELCDLHRRASSDCAQLKTGAATAAGLQGEIVPSSGASSSTARKTSTSSSHDAL